MKLTLQIAAAISLAVLAFWVVGWLMIGAAAQTLPEPHVQAAATAVEPNEIPYPIAIDQSRNLPQQPLAAATAKTCEVVNAKGEHYYCGSK
jgi:hypothetical protein